MALYRYRITPLSAFATPLRSDTLYGHLIWRAAERYGQDKVSELLQDFGTASPPFRLSSAVPAHCLPIPVLPPIDREVFRRNFAPQGGRELVAALQEYKAFRKSSLIRYEKLKKLASGLNPLNLFDAWRQNRQDFPAAAGKNAIQPHNSIDRQSGRVLSEGGLHFSASNWYEPGSELDLYVETEEKALFEELFDDVAQTGFGADRGIGKGHFSWSKHPVALIEDWPAEGNARLLLSLTSAESLRPLGGYWKPEVKHGRAWSGFGEKNPFKKPFLALSEGSLLTALPETGYLLHHIHSNADLVQILWPVTLPVNLEMNHAD